jgi:hypothetical protein
LLTPPGYTKMCEYTLSRYACGHNAHSNETIKKHCERLGEIQQISMSAKLSPLEKEQRINELGGHCEPKYLDGEKVAHKCQRCQDTPSL